jgi:hypothetical protein
VKKKKGAAKKTTSMQKKPATRADLGAPIDGFFAKRPPAQREILDALRALIEEADPKVESSIKWGNPFFMLNGRMMAALTAHKAHVNLIVVGPPEGFDDPKKLLTGEGKGGRHLKLTSLEDLPRAAVKSWLRTAVRWAKR